MRAGRRLPPPVRAAVLLLAVLAVTLAGCKSGKPKENPILRLSSEEALARGEELMERKKYAQAREYFTHAFEVAPNSASGRQALLRVADAFYLDGGENNYIRAEAKYRDFQNRFPTSDRGAYVQLQMANSLAERVLRPDRDQTSTRKAIEAYEDLLRLYPTSGYAPDARTRLVELRNTLAEHEFIIGRYNMRRRLWRGAIGRLEALMAEYPNYPEKDKALYHLGLAYRGAREREKAIETFARLREEFKDSPWVAKIPEVKIREEKVPDVKVAEEKAPDGKAPDAVSSDEGEADVEEADVEGVDEEEAEEDGPEEEDPDEEEPGGGATQEGAAR